MIKLEEPSTKESKSSTATVYDTVSFDWYEVKRICVAERDRVVLLFREARLQLWVRCRQELGRMPVGVTVGGAEYYVQPDGNVVAPSGQLVNVPASAQSHWPQTLKHWLKVQQALQSVRSVDQILTVWAVRGPSV